ncbi:hypothetical protein Tco_0388867 [Tanacetum coccineum]
MNHHPSMEVSTRTTRSHLEASRRRHPAAANGSVDGRKLYDVKVLVDASDVDRVYEVEGTFLVVICLEQGHGEAGIGTTLTRGAVVVAAAYRPNILVSHMLEEICMTALHKASYRLSYKSHHQMDMMTKYSGGIERTEDEYLALFKGVGFT